MKVQRSGMGRGGGYVGEQVSARVQILDNTVVRFGVRCHNAELILMPLRDHNGDTTGTYSFLAISSIVERVH